MRKTGTIVLLFLATMLFAQNKIIIKCGKLVDAKNNKILENRTIVVVNGKIDEVTDKKVTLGKNDTFIDLSSKTVMPGLIDMHVHLEHETNAKQYLEEFTMNEADIAYRSIGYAEKTLLSGFTTVRDLGGTNVNISLRRAIDAGLVKGPRVFTAGKSIASTGGHADPTNGYRSDLMGNPGPESGVANGVDECVKAVRQRYKNGSDLIKITASGGVLSVAKSGENSQFTIEEIQAIVKTANDYGFKVAAHCHGEEAMRRAVIGGVHSIEHGTYMSEEVMQLMKEHGTYLVPTVTAGKAVGQFAKIPNYYPDIVVPKALAIGPKIQNTFERAYKYGVKIAFGTDAGVFVHGDNWKEFIYMSEVGMPFMEILKTATINASDLLGQSEFIGTIEKGKFADIIAVDGNPTKDIEVMGKVTFVMKAGEVFKNE
ncbi:amidohydrolase family protein [Flavobacterium sp. HNIBRBA15423]|uniref:amidohydrolase family protein n=1 Tax=Flavobacterium sp. HNIBRBA15423 TaxID=3458683 RepID=UPI004044774A